jgi:tetratricopeptide (TPR) repeat protein
MQHADRAIILTPEDAQGHLWKGYALWRQGRWDQAAPALRRAVELAPRDAMASYFMGVGSFLEGARHEALPYLRRSVELEPRNAMGWLALGCDHLMLLDLVEAERALTRCLPLECDPAARFLTAGAAGFLAETLRIAGRLNEARRRAAEGIEAAEASDHPYRDTFRAYGLCVLGRTALQQGDVDGARAAYGQVIAQLRGRTRPRSCGHLMVQALAGLGRVGGDAGAFAEALHLFEARHTWNFEHFNGCLPDIDLLELARAAHALGREAEAAALLARAHAAGAREPLLP